MFDKILATHTQRCFWSLNFVWTFNTPEHAENNKKTWLILRFVHKTYSISPFAENTRRNETLRNVSQSIFLRKEIAHLRRVVGESACYTCIYVFETKRRTTIFKVKKALNNKFVCVFITCKVYRNWMLIKFTTGIIVRQENRSWSEGLRKPSVKVSLSIKPIAL